MFTQLEAGVDGIITNHPAKMMKALLDRHGKKCLPNL
jgi:glycerophosphoryl diester phosphodiesterase